MKTNFSTLILLLVLALNSFQATAFSKANTPLTIAELSESYDYLRVAAAIACNNAILVIGKYKKDKESDYTNFLMQINTSGDILWEKQLDHDVTALEKAGDTEFWVAGNKKDPDSKKSEILLHKYNIKGEHLTLQTISDPSDSYSVFDLTTFNNGNILVCGSYDDYPATQSTNRNDRMLVINVNSYGQIIWKKVYEQFQHKIERALRIKSWSDGSFVFTGRSRDFNTDDFTLVTAKAFSNGELEWIQKYGGDRHVDQDGATPGNIIINKKGEIVITGQSNALGFVYFKGTRNWPIDLLVLKYNTYGEYDWEYTLGDKTIKERERGLDIIENSNGGYTVLGSIAKDNHTSNDVPAILLLSEEGEKLVVNEIGSKQYDYSRLIKLEATNQLFAIGTHKGDDERYKFALKAIKSSELH